MEENIVKLPEGGQAVTSGACRYCGQFHQVPLFINAETQLEADAYATEHCDCDAARRTASIERAREKIARLFKGYDDAVIVMLYVIAENVQDDAIEAASIKVDYLTTAKITKTSKGLLTITRTDKTEQQEVV